MNIVLFTSFFYPSIGGVEQYCLEISTRLAQRGHQVTVITSNLSKNKRQEVYKKVEIIRLDSWIILGGNYPIPKYSRNNIKILQELFLKKPDLIITNTRFYPLTLLALLYSKKHNIKSCHIEHGSCYSRLSNPIAGLLAIMYDQTFGRLVFKLATKHLAVSKAAATFSGKLGGRQVEVIYNSVDPTEFTLKKYQDAPITKILYVGRLIEAKGVQDLIKAVELLPDLSIEVNVIGKGNYREELEKLAAKTGKVTFLGEKTKEEIVALLENSDIFVNPSYSEGLPTSVLEAGAAGVPVIATDVGGTREIICDNKDGLLVPIKNPALLAEKIRTIIESPETGRGFAQNLRAKIVSDFNWETTVQKLEETIT